MRTTWTCFRWLSLHSLRLLRKKTNYKCFNSWLKMKAFSTNIHFNYKILLRIIRLVKAHRPINLPRVFLRLLNTIFLELNSWKYSNKIALFCNRIINNNYKICRWMDCKGFRWLKTHLIHPTYLSDHRPNMA